MDLITKIRQAEAPLHAASEHTGFIKKITDGTATKETYGEYLFNLSVMYKAIEETLDANADNEVLKPFVTKELYKHELIEKDLEYLLGDSVKNLTLLASTKAFLARIDEIKDTNPELIIAHAYTRFLADLFGGRMFMDLFTNRYHIAKEGLNYYKCEGVDDIRTYVMGYAMKLNNLNLSEDLEKKLIDEVSNAYIYNLAVSCELEFKLNPPQRQEHAQHPHSHPHGQQHTQHQHPHQHHHHK